MKLSRIKELLQLVADSRAAEVEIEEDGFKLTIRQNPPVVMMQPPAYNMSGVPYGSPQYAPQQGQQQGNPGYGGAQGAPQQQGGQQQVAQSSGTGGGSSSNSASGGSQQAAGSSTSENGAAAETAASEGTEVKAPIVGTFYRSPSPDADPFVRVGDKVAEGDVLCIIEAMKLMNEIECETPGTVKEILIDDGEPVEFDQPLFVIEEG